MPKVTKWLQLIQSGTGKKVAIKVDDNVTLFMFLSQIKQL